MIYPNYQNGSIVNLVCSILKYYNISTDSDPLPNFTLPQHKRMVFMVIDGMGYHFLKNHAPQSFLFKSCKKTLTSVFPSTTSAALTSLMTGVSPLQHAMTGWFMYLKELGVASVSLPFTPRFSGKPFNEMDVDIHKIYDFETIFTKINNSMKIISHKPSINSAFSNFCFRDKPKIGFDTVEECFSLIESELKESTEMIYAYIATLDDMAHQHGIAGKETIDLLLQIDDLYHNLVQNNSDDTLFIVTADHGLIDTTPDTILYLSDYPNIDRCLVLPLCGEPRVPYCYVRPSCIDIFRELIDERLGKYCDRFTLSELLEKNLFGSGVVNPKVYDRIGDEILIMKKNYVLIDKVYAENQKKYIGFHGGLSTQEMEVPLIVNI